MMTSSEHYALCAFILSTPDKRTEILSEAERDPKVSGVLIHAYRTILPLL